MQKVPAAPTRANMEAEAKKCGMDQARHLHLPPVFALAAARAPCRSSSSSRRCLRSGPARMQGKDSNDCVLTNFLNPVLDGRGSWRGAAWTIQRVFGVTREVTRAKRHGPV